MIQHEPDETPIRRRSAKPPVPSSRYRHRSRAGLAVIRFLAIAAAGMFIAGLLNRPSGDWSPAVDITPTHTSNSATFAR